MLITKPAKRHFFLRFSLFSNKIDKKKDTKSLTTAWPVLWFFGSFKEQGQLQSTQAPFMGLCWLNLKNITLFQSKLNELPQEVSLAYKFFLTIHMQYFEVSILVFFKCQLIPVVNSLNKNIAFFQKGKKTIFQKSLFVLKENRQKEANPNFQNGTASCLRDGSLWTAIGCRGRISLPSIYVDEACKDPFCLKANLMNFVWILISPLNCR